MFRLFHVQQVLLKVYPVGQDPVHKPLQEQDAISSISSEDADPSPKEQIVGRASALVNHIPSLYDKEALKYKLVVKEIELDRVARVIIIAEFLQWRLVIHVLRLVEGSFVVIRVVKKMLKW